MNFVNLPLSILLFAVVYLISIYGLLTIAQMFKREDNVVRHNQENNSQIKIP